LKPATRRAVQLTATRRQLLARAARGNLIVAGAHLGAAGFHLVNSDHDACNLQAVDLTTISRP
jgi:hypothetical protein